MRGARGLTDDLVDLAIANAGRAGEPAESRSAEVEAGRANGATSRRREGRTSCPGEGGNAATQGKKNFASVPIEPNWGIAKVQKP
jgi:hypothetical protein